VDAILAVAVDNVRFGRIPVAAKTRPANTKQFPQTLPVDLRTLREELMNRVA
jgi:hypothetical protein